MGGLAVSKGQKGYIVSLVGTRNNDMTHFCSFFDKINEKQAIPGTILENFISNWIREYYNT